MKTVVEEAAVVASIPDPLQKSYFAQRQFDLMPAERRFDCIAVCWDHEVALHFAEV